MRKRKWHNQLLGLLDGCHDQTARGAYGFSQLSGGKSKVCTTGIGLYTNSAVAMVNLRPIVAMIFLQNVFIFFSPLFDGIVELSNQVIRLTSEVFNGIR